MIPRHLGRWRLPTSARIALALAVEMAASFHAI